MIKKRTPRDFKFIRLLGEGSFSSVYLAVDADASSKSHQKSLNVINPENGTNVNESSAGIADGQMQKRIRLRKYAIKVCQKSHIKRQGKQVAIMREKEIMNILNRSPNEHFINLYCTFQDMERLFFVMSYAENGELLTYMLEHPLSLNAVMRFTLQLVSALEHMHKLNIVHRDLKPENILLSDHLNILISDFGSAQIFPDMSRVQQPAVSTATVDAQSSTGPQESIATSNSGLDHNGTGDAASTVSISSAHTDVLSNNNNNNNNNSNNNTGDRRNSFVGTAQYVSPEMLSERRASNKSDLWALGVIIYQMITNVMPFDAPNEYLIYKKIQALDYTYPDNFDLNARNLISSLVQLEPTDRLGAHDDLQTEGYKSIRAHQFLAQVPDENHPLENVDLPEGGTIEDPDLRNLDKISPGLDETQMLRLLTEG